MLVNLNKQNKIKIYSVKDDKFKTFGNVLEGFDTNEIISVSKTIQMPEINTIYTASEPKFETLEIAKQIKEKCFGHMPVQIGYCYGKSSRLNGTEWHASNEINIATTPLVLLLAHIWDMDNNKIDSSCFKAFYLPQGTVCEIYSTSLHFCPCQVTEDGFGMVVALSEGTNTDLDKKDENPLLFRKNKWIIAHNDNKALIDRGVIPGISGENIKISY